MENWKKVSRRTCEIKMDSKLKYLTLIWVLLESAMRAEADGCSQMKKSKFCRAVARIFLKGGGGGRRAHEY